LVANPEDFVELKFDIATVDSVKGLHAYMNTLLNANEIMISFQLRRVPAFWGYQEQNYIYYMMAPPWIKMRVVRTSI